MMRTPRVIGLLLPLALAGCSVGPRYTRPSVPIPLQDSFKELEGWKAAQPSDQTRRGNWWKIFGDAELDALEEQLTLSNQDLKTAEARFREAREFIAVSRAGQYPRISTATSAAFVHYSSNAPTFPSTTHLPATGEYILSFDISYEVDMWGRVHQSVTAAREEAQAAAADLENVSLSLHAELAFNYFELRSADGQGKLLDDTVKAYTDALRLTIDRFEGGAVPKSDVAQARTQLESIRVQAADIAVQRAAYEHAIAVLVGKPPAGFHIAPALLDLQPPNIPVGVPSQLLERRPDIAAAERRVAAANEQVGIARAAFFPTVLLSASAGVDANHLSNLFTWPSSFWTLGPSAAQSIFDAGHRRAASRAAVANYEASSSSYRQTVLTAFQEVEDSLAALRTLEQEADQQHAATSSAQESLQIFNDRYIGGADPYLQVIAAQTTALINKRNDVDILRRRMDASVLLIKALGGRWNVF